jgi:PAS domain S-box-containing protein
MKSTIGTASSLVLAAGVAILLANGTAYYFNLSDQAIWAGLTAFTLIVIAAVLINLRGEDRRLTEARLRKQERRYRLVTDALPAMIGYVDNHHRLLYHNKAYQEWLGLPAERLDNCHLSEILGQEVYVSLLPRIEQALRGQKASYERSQRLADGSQRNLEGTLMPDIDDQGRVHGYFAMILDVTARNRAEEALRESEHLLDETQRVANIGSWAMDFATRKANWSRQFYEIHGIAPEGEFDNNDYLHLIIPEDRERAAHEFFSALKDGSSDYTQEFRILRPDGSVRDLHVKGAFTRGANGLALRAIGVTHDITERKQSEDELRRANERLDLALHGSRLAIWDGDPITGKVFLSEGWAEMLGYEPLETHTDTAGLMEIAHPEDRERITKAIVAALKGATPEYLEEHRVRTRTGEWKWILSHGQVVLRDASGRALRFTGTNSDISARKEIERMKNEFISVVSHELRTPLTSIVGSLGLLARMGNPSEEFQTLVRIAQGNSHRLVRLINDILDVEKLESGMLSISLEPVNLVALLKSALQANQGYAEQHGASLVLTGAQESAWVRANTDRLMQVMANLLSNAAKFSPRGAPIIVSLERADRLYRVSVTDRGPGVPDEFKPRVFSKFAQADSSPSRQTGGTGLGLAISKSIIEKLGGKIGYAGGSGPGATFYFELEAHARIAAPAPERRKDARPVST